MQLNDILLSVKNLKTFSTRDINILIKYYNIKSVGNDGLWQLSIAILNDPNMALSKKSAKMSPTKVFEKYGEQLFNKISNDKSVENVVGSKDPEAIKLKIIEMDPDKGKNVEWMVISYINNGIKLFEDLGRANSAIKKYNWLVSKKLIDSDDPANKFLRTLVDFGGLVGYKNTKNQEKVGLETFLNNYKNQLIEYEKQFALAESAPNERIVHYNGPNLMIIEPLTEAAACKYGANTQWCTAARENNMFKHYNDQGSLFILIPKHPKHAGEKYQVHFESDSVMDEHDISVDIYNLYIKYPEFRDFAMKHLEKLFATAIEKDPTASPLYIALYNPKFFAYAIDLIKNNETGRPNDNFIDEIKNIVKNTTKNPDGYHEPGKIQQSIVEKMMLLLNIDITDDMVSALLENTANDYIILELIENGKIPTNIPKKVFDMTVKDNDKIDFSLTRRLFLNITIDLINNTENKTIIELNKSLEKADFETEPRYTEKLLQNMKIPVPKFVYEVLADIDKEYIIMNLIKSGKIDINTTFNDGTKTLLSYITNIDDINTLLKTIIPKKIDLRNLIQELKVDDFLNLSKHFTSKDFTDIMIESYMYKNDVDIKKVLQHDKTDVPAFINALVSYSRKYIKELLDDPRYPTWTMDVNPLKYVNFGKKKSALNPQFFTILEHERTLPFLKSLSYNEISKLISIIEKKKYYENVQDDFKKYMITNLPGKTPFDKN
jgi:hypothetical protein